MKTFVWLFRFWKYVGAAFGSLWLISKSSCLSPCDIWRCNNFWVNEPGVFIQDFDATNGASIKADLRLILGSKAACWIENEIPHCSSAMSSCKRAVTRWENYKRARFVATAGNKQSPAACEAALFKHKRLNERSKQTISNWGNRIIALVNCCGATLGSSI